MTPPSASKSRRQIPATPCSRFRNGGMSPSVTLSISPLNSKLPRLAKRFQFRLRCIFPAFRGLGASNCSLRRGCSPPAEFLLKKWKLVVRVPEGFLVHASGGSKKTSRSGREIAVQSLQHPEDRYPFVVAGLYREAALDAGTGHRLFSGRALKKILRACSNQRMASCASSRPTTRPLARAPKSPSRSGLWNVR